MRKFLLGLNKLGLINVENLDGDVIRNSDAVALVDCNNLNSRLLKFKNLFADTEHKYGLVIDKDFLLVENGEKLKLKDVFSKVKPDNRKRKPKDGDVVEIQKCFNDDVIITTTSAKWKKDLATNYGIVKSINKDGIADISVSGYSIKLPTICIKKVSGQMSDTVASMLAYAVNKGYNVSLLPEFKYMDMTKDGKYIEYISEDRISRFKGDFWNRELRDKFATKKKIRSVLGKIVEDSVKIEDELIAMYGEIDLDVEIIKGKDIYDVFKRDNVATSGSISQSCMLNKSNSYFDIYAENAECAIVKNKAGVIVLRAIIWNLIDNDNPRKTIKFLDRIYSRNDSQVALLRAWAARKGYLTLSVQIHSETRAVAPNGDKVDLSKYHVKLVRKEYENYPYIDTMYMMVDGKLYAGNAIKRAHSTSGSLS